MGMREDYQVPMEKQLTDWAAQTARFKVGAARVETQSKEQYERHLEFLRTKQEEAWGHFYRMKSASEEMWQQVKANMDQAAAEVKRAAERMTQQFKA